MITNIFLSPSDRRLRAGWRILLQTVLLFLVSGLLGAPLLLLSSLWANLAQGASYFLINSLLIAASTTLSVFFARIYLDRRSIVSLGLSIDRQMAKDLLVGFAIPAVQFSLVFLVGWLAGWLEIDGFAWQELSPVQAVLGLLFMFALFSLVSWGEELLSRGYWLQNLADGLGLPWGILLSSLGFALFHLANPNVTWLSITGLFLSGIFLAYAYTTTRQLWLPIGLHLGWNFFEGAIFGFPVSGTAAFGLIVPTVRGPEILTGGAFGPEGGLILLPALIVGFLMVWWYTKRRQTVGTPGPQR